MKRKEDLIKSQAKLTPSELESIKWVVEELSAFKKEDTICESELLRLENLIGSLNIVRSTYTKRLIKLLKQGHMLD